MGLATMLRQLAASLDKWERIPEQLNRLELQGVLLMSKAEDIKAGLQAIKDATDQEALDNAAQDVAVTGLGTRIDALKAQLAEVLSGVPGVDADAILATLSGMSATALATSERIKAQTVRLEGYAANPEVPVPDPVEPIPVDPIPVDPPPVEEPTDPNPPVEEPPVDPTTGRRRR